MDLCFLFAEHLDSSGCLSCALSPEGELVAPLQHRTFAQLRELQTEKKNLCHRELFTG